MVRQSPCNVVIIVSSVTVSIPARRDVRPAYAPGRRLRYSASPPPIAPMLPLCHFSACLCGRTRMRIGLTKQVYSVSGDFAALGRRIILVTRTENSAYSLQCPNSPQQIVLSLNDQHRASDQTKAIDGRKLGRRQLALALCLC